MKFPEGSSVQGCQCNCFLCHLSLPSRPYRPRASTHQNSLGAQAWSPSLFTVLMHKALCTCTSSPIRSGPKGIPIWTPAPDPGVCLLVLEPPQVTLGTFVRGNPLGIQTGEYQVVVWEDPEVQEVGPSKAPPLEVGEATPPPSLLVLPVLPPSQSAGDA